MLQFISGKEIADVKESEHKVRVQNLKNKGIVPRLAIIQTVSSSVIDTYVRVKKAYAKKNGIVVEHYNVNPEATQDTISKLNNDTKIHGIIVQLPLHETLDQTTVLHAVTKTKDVDGLVLGSDFIPPTVKAIVWLMDAYIPNLDAKRIALVGKGRLVGAPLEKELLKRGITVKIFTKEDMLDILPMYKVIVSATGVPSLLNNTHISSGAYVLDAGTAEENGALHGDVADEVYERDDVHITPTKGGVGILTVRGLFENVLFAAEKSTH